jgi:hypothetical protein
MEQKIILVKRAVLNVRTVCNGFEESLHFAHWQIVVGFFLPSG